MRSICVFALPLLVLCGASWALEAGVAACDITPDPAKYKVPLSGYGAREGKPATGIHDRLKAKVLVLRDGDTRMALVTTDLRSVTPELKAQVVGAAQDLGLSADNLLICASHTHDGPAMYAEQFWQLQFGVYDPRIVREMSTAIAGALREATASAFSAKVGVAQTQLEGFARNRRWSYDTAARVAAGETPCVRPRLWVMRVDTAEGAPRAIVANFATHPTILDADNMLISAEWPGVYQERLEAEFPGAQAFFMNGAEGDQSPVADEGKDDFDRLTRFGEAFAARVSELVKTVTTESNFSIAYARVTPELPAMVFSPAAAAGRYRDLEPVARRDLPKRAEIQVLRVGDTALVGLPGEPLCVVGAMVEEAVCATGAKSAVAVGLANDYVGYIVDDREYAHGGYEVDSRSYYGPGLGRFMADHAAEAARRLVRPD